MAEDKSTIRVCSIEECEKEVRARGWCTTHYARWSRTGDPETARAYFTSPEEAFEARTEWQGGCLVWTGATSPKGYGQIHISPGVRVPVHRYSWEREVGPIPEGFLIDHTCYNPSCVRVEHLRLATNTQNVRNRKGPNTNNTSGHRNVSWHKVSEKWRVRVKKDRKEHYFGLYADKDEAIAVAEGALQDLFGEFAGKS